MKNFILIIFTSILITSTNLFSYEFETNYDHFSAFEVDENYFYIGLMNGIVIQERNGDGYEYFNSLNSGLRSNYINDFIIDGNLVYISTKGGLHLYKNGEIEYLDVSDTDTRDLQLDSFGNLWTFNSDEVIKVSGNNVNRWNLTENINYRFDIDRIDILEDKVWVTFYNQQMTASDYYSFVNQPNYKFALINLKNDEVTTFPDSVRGFTSGYTVSYVTVGNNEVWTGTARREDQFIYDINANEWRKNDYLTQLPDKYEFIIWDFVTDKNGDIWFAINVLEGPLEGRRLPAKFDYSEKKFEILYEDIAEEKDIDVFYVDVFKDDIVYRGSGAYYIINENGLSITNSEELRETKTYSSGMSYSDGEYFILLRDQSTSYKNISISNITTKTEIGYLPENELPIPALDSYVKSNNLEIIKGGRLKRQLRSYAKWKNGWQLADSFSFDLSWFNYKNTDDGKLYFIAPDLQYFDGTEFKKFTDIIKDKNEYSLTNFSISDQNYIYTLGSYNTDEKEYDNFISILDNDGNIIHSYTPENSCMPDYYYEGKIILRLRDTVAGDFELDLNNNIWVTTNKSLLKIDEEGNCQQIENFPKTENNFNEITDLIYSEKQNKLYAFTTNSISQIENNSFQEMEYSDLGISGRILKIKTLSDGNVYFSTSSGFLYKVINYDQIQSIEIIQNMDSLPVPINDFYFNNDSIYVSTNIGLIKSGNVITFVESDEITQEKLNVYPNPSENFLQINLEKNINLAISDIRGNEIKQLGNIKEKEIDISDLTPGVYFLVDENNEMLGKFVKK